MLLISLNNNQRYPAIELYFIFQFTNMSIKWNLLVVTIWLFISTCILEKLISSNALGSKFYNFSSKTGACISTLTYMFFGWLADTRYGRYKVIKYSLHILWITSVFYCLLSVVLELLSAYGVLEDLEGKQHAVHVSWYIVLGLGLGGLLANIIQFSIDQLQDRSSEEITSFLRWGGLVWLISIPVTHIPYNYLNRYCKIANSIILPAMLTLALCLDYFCVSLLMKNPVSSNPLSIIFRIMRFATYNKYPLRRSAHSYWNSSFCARIDLAKTEYGGPFTANQVEDTKAFWRIVPIIVCASLFFSLIFLVTSDVDRMKYSLTRDNELVEDFFQYLGILIIGIALALFELMLCSRVRTYVNNTPILIRSIFGMIILLASILSCGIIEAVGNHLNNNDTYNNKSVCVFYLDQYQLHYFPLSYKWMVIPYSLQYWGGYLMAITAIEFHCAQSPYSMKGLLAGLWFGCLGGSSGLHYAWLLPFQTAIKNSRIGQYIGCGAVYFFSIFLILLFMTFCFCCIWKLYKPLQERRSGREEEIVDVDYYYINHQEE